jgi:hypothetical protein
METRSPRPSGARPEIPVPEQKTIVAVLRPLVDSGTISASTLDGLRRFLSGKIQPVHLPTDESLKNCISRRDAARRIGVSTRTLDNYGIPRIVIAEGGRRTMPDGKIRRCGGSIRYRLADVEAFLDSKSVEVAQ